MAIKRYIANADTTITNAYKANLSIRGTGSNMGASDISEVFTVYAQAASASVEAARILTKFPITDIAAHRASGTIPASGSVDFYLRLYNARHGQTLPNSFDLHVMAVSRSWEEGTGLDMENFTDLTYDDTGANWERAASGSVDWTTDGGDYWDDPSSSFTASFSTGVEDLEVNISPLVEQWLSSSTAISPIDDAVIGAKANYGVIVKYPSSYETAQRSYYTKKFFARGSEFWFKRPVIEARWDSSDKDDAGNFYLSSSLVTATENLNTIYLYNNIRGQLRDIPSIGKGKIMVSIYSGSTDNSTPSTLKHTLPIGGGVVTDDDLNITGSYVTTGTYSASFAYTSSATTKIFPVWHSGTTPTEYHTGSKITVNTFKSTDYNPSPSYVTTITNLKSVYSRDEEARFRLFVREKDWSPNIYTKAKSDPQNVIIEDAYFKVIRTIDETDVIGYGTGSLNHTRLSFDASGNYFDLGVSLLEKDYMYGIKVLYKLPNGLYKEQSHVFKFRVE